MSSDDVQRDLGRIEARLDAGDERMQRIEARLDDIARSVNKLTSYVDRHKGAWALIGLLVGGGISALVEFLRWAAHR